MFGQNNLFSSNTTNNQSSVFGTHNTQLSPSQNQRLNFALDRSPLFKKLSLLYNTVSTDCKFVFFNRSTNSDTTVERPADVSEQQWRAALLRRPVSDPSLSLQPVVVRSFSELLQRSQLQKQAAETLAVRRYQAAKALSHVTTQLEGAALDKMLKRQEEVRLLFARVLKKLFLLLGTKLHLSEQENALLTKTENKLGKVRGLLIDAAFVENRPTDEQQHKFAKKLRNTTEAADRLQQLVVGIKELRVWLYVAKKCLQKVWKRKDLSGLARLSTY